MNKKVISGVLSLGLISSIAFASPVNLPTGIKNQQGLGIGGDSDIGQDFSQTSAGVIFDYVGKRELNKDSGSANFDMIGGEIDLSVYKNYDIYTVLGGATSSQFKANLDGDSTQWDLSNDFMWEVGVDGILYDWQSTGIQFFGDGNYRQASSIGLDSVTIDGTKYPSSDFGSVSANWQEWQAALGISRPFQYFIPYGGVLYSDVRTSAKVNISGTTIDSGSLSSKDKVGAFVGVSILPTQWLSIDVTGRFVTEESVSVSATVKF
jgi:hypothetical protein